MIDVVNMMSTCRDLLLLISRQAAKLEYTVPKTAGGSIQMDIGRDSLFQRVAQ